MVRGPQRIDSARARRMIAEINPEEMAEFANNAIVVEGDENRISIRPNPNYNYIPYSMPNVSISRLDDGSLDINSNSAYPNPRTMLPNPDREQGDRGGFATMGIKRSIEDALIESIAEEILRRNGLGAENAAEHNPNIYTLAHEIRESGWINNLPRPLARRIQGINHLIAFNLAIEGLMDSEVYQSLRRTHGPVSIENYNRTMAGGASLQQLRDTNPMAFVWASARHDHTPGEPYEHPGQIVTEVRTLLEESGLDKKHWRAASRLSPETLNKIIDRNASRQEIATLLNAIAKYQIGDPSDENLHLAQRALRRLQNRHYGQNQGDVPERVASLALRNEYEFENEQEIEDVISNMSDYLSNMMRNNEQLTSNTWRGLMRASNRWHREQVHREMARRIEEEMARNEGKIRAWNSLLPTVEFEHSSDPGKDITVTPMISVVDLQREGLEMHHCVGSYGNQCVNGNTRIFSIRGEDGTRATMEIVNNNGNWTMNQVKGVHNEAVTPEIRSLAQEVAREYNHAWRETPGQRGQDKHTVEWVLPEELDRRRAEEEAEREREANAPQAPISVGDVPMAETPDLGMQDIPDMEAPEELRADAGRVREQQELEREADARMRARNRGQEAMGMPDEPGYQRRGGRGGREFRRR